MKLLRITDMTKNNRRDGARIACEYAVLAFFVVIYLLRNAARNDCVLARKESAFARNKCTPKRKK